MNIRDLAALAFLLAGIYALLNVVFMLQALMAFPFYLDETHANPVGLVVVLAFSILVLLASGVFLVVRREWLAGAVFPKDQTGIGPVTAAQLEDLALSALGLYFVVSVVPELSGLATGLINLREMGDKPEIVAAFRNNVGVYLGTLAQLVIGAYLCFKGHVLGEFLRKQRSPKIKGSGALTSLPRCPACGTPFNPSHYAATATDPRCSSCHEPLPRSSFGAA